MAPLVERLLSPAPFAADHVVFRRIARHSLLPVRLRRRAAPPPFSTEAVMRQRTVLFVSPLLLVVVAAAIGLTVPALREPLMQRLRNGGRSAGDGEQSAAAKTGTGAAEHSEHAAHGNADSLTLSKQAQANIGLTLGRIELTTYERSITIPGILRDRPGRSTVAVTAPLTGIVTQIYPIEGEAVRPGQKLFEVRLTHEELVQAQGDLLRVAEESDVVNREIVRLEKIVADGGIAARQVLERRYEQQNKQAVLRAQQQALLLHGFSEAQIADILSTRTLLKNLTVVVPDEAPVANSRDNPEPRMYEIRELRVERGQSVTAGDALAVLVDHAELFIEGNAFDKDVAAVNRAVALDATLGAVFEADDGPPEVISGLKILYVAGTVDAATRTFHFYVRLDNPLVRDAIGPDGHRFLSRRYKPGQRVQLTVPVERWPERIVLPAQAVVQDGVETYVFSPNGAQFDRRPVHVEYRDRLHAVVADDGSLFPGDTVVLTGAQQMQLALKNQAGGAIDPHAGHNH